MATLRTAWKLILWALIVAVVMGAVLLGLAWLVSAAAGRPYLG